MSTPEPAPVDETTPPDELVERVAKAMWDAVDGYITSIPWSPRVGFHADKERRRARAAITAMAAELAELQRRLDLVRDYAAFNRKYGGDETVRGDVAWMLARIASGECQQIGADR